MHLLWSTTGNVVRRRILLGRSCVLSPLDIEVGTTANHLEISVADGRRTGSGQAVDRRWTGGGSVVDRWWIGRQAGLALNRPPPNLKYGCFRREGADTSGDGWPSLDHHHHRHCSLAKTYAPNHLPQVIACITVVEK
jgi:hypothetical protein